MKKIVRLRESINLDEAADNFSDGLDFVVQNNIQFVEIRTVNGKNILNLSLEETKNVARTIKKYEKRVSAIASPLFKWYVKGDKSTAEFDSFGVDPQVGETAKKKYIVGIINRAQILETSLIRVFSGLKTKNNNRIMKQTEIELMRFALKKARQKGIKLLLENEPACAVSDFDDYVKTLKYFQKDGLMAWVDIANFYEIGRQVNKKMLAQLSTFIEYIHIKDPIGMKRHSFVPVGDGCINYKRIFSDLVDVLSKPVFFSIETHVRDNKGEASQKSLSYVRSLIYNSRKRYAIVGAGRVSAKHAIACNRSNASELRGVFDIKADRMKSLVKRYDCERYSSLEKVLSDPNIDVVNICSPNNTHLNTAQRVVESGKIALCEKPFSINLDDLKKYAVNPRFNRNTYIVFQKRFSPTAMRFLKLVKNGSLGKIISFSIRINWWRDFNYFADWHGDEKISGGPLFMQAIHAIDLLGNAVDLDIDSVSGYSRRSRVNLPANDIISAVVRLKNGVIGQIEVNLSTFRKNIEESLFIAGSKGSIKVGGIGLSEDNHTQTAATGLMPQRYFDADKGDYFGGGHTRLVQTLSNKLLDIPDENIALLAHPRDIIKVIGFTRTVYDALIRI